MEKYEYNESIGSDQLRVLTLHPATDHELIVCTLETLPVTTEVSHHNDYEALSYVWGSKDDMRSITCGRQRLSVTKDLWIALQHLRHKSSARRLWIDQLCINQEDLDERAAQVSIMANIYRSATQVVIWLGPEAENSDLALEFAPRLSKALSEYRKTHQKEAIISHHLGKVLEATDFYLPLSDASEWTALSDLYSRKWFQRLWIVQEALLNKSTLFKCGASQCSWQVIEKLCEHLIKEMFLRALVGQRPESSRCYSVLTDMYLLKRSIGSHHLDFLIYIFSKQQAADPRDYIYALLSLAPKSEAECFVPDYRKSTSDVYTDFARVMIEKFGKLDVLHNVQLDVEYQVKTPSWVSNWSGSKDTLDYPVKMNHSIFNASKSSTRLILFEGSGSILKLKGRQIDVLLEEGLHCPIFDSATMLENMEEKEMENFTSVVDFIEKGRELADSCKFSSENTSSDIMFASACSQEHYRRKSPETITPEEASQKLLDFYQGCKISLEAKQLVASYSEDSWIRRNRYEVNWKTRLWPLIFAPGLSWRALGMVPMQIAASGFNTYFTMHLRGNCITKTREGLLANISRQYEKGDIVAVLYGLKTPFVLRPVQDGYLLVGECYVYGIMHGEAIEKSMGNEKEFRLI